MNPGARYSGRRRRSLILGLVAILVLAVVVAVVLVTRSPSSSRSASVEHRAITMSDGVALQAIVVKPKATSSGQHFPLLIIPTSWGAKENAFALLAGHLAEHGYLVVAYTQRGQTDSGGRIDFAGARTQSDVSEVIDWALEHTRADPKQIGMFGSSYGGGISLLAAAQDRRIRAVVATSAWADLAGALTQNDTVSTQVLKTLFNGVRLDPTFQQLDEDLSSDPQAVAQRFHALSPVRSPMHYVSMLNRNDPAIMIANGFEDHLLPPRQLIRFFEALKTPKRLQLGPGDHQQIEYKGIIGQPDPAVDNAVAWFDHYLRGRDEPITSQAPIQLQDVRTMAWTGYRTWPRATAQDTFDLSEPGTASIGTASIGTTPSAWSAAIGAGVDTVATSGIRTAYPPISAALKNLSTTHAVAWSGPKLGGATQVTGAGSLHLSLASSTSSATVFVYVYDVALSDYGTLMSVTPYTATGLTPAVARKVTIGLQPITWTLPASHHLEVVIDTVDPRYHSTAGAGSTVTFSSTAADPATVTIPVS